METDTQKLPEIVDGSRALATEMRSQREVAISNPRNELKVFEASLKELEIAPEFAEDAYYSIPYASKAGDDGEKIMVEGLSVKASRAVARRWGNCATASRIVGEDDAAVEVEGIFADFETNVFFRRVVRVPKIYIPKNTKIPTPLRSDRLNMAILAGMSKAERNATLAGLPEYLKERYFKEAKRIAGSKGKKEGQTPAQRFEALYAAFGKLGVEKARIVAYIEANFADSTSPDDVLGTMRGIYNAIKDGQVKADETFAAPTVPEKGKNKISLGDIPGAGL